MPAGLTPWQTAVISALAALVGGLALLLLGVIVQEVRDATRERLHIERVLYEHIADQHKHEPTHPQFPPSWRAP